MASSLVSENLYPVFRATEMKTNFVRVLENLPFPNHALRPKLDALMMAKPESTLVSDWSNASNQRLLAARCRSAFMTGDGERYGPTTRASSTDGQVRASGGDSSTG
jgi:hypothetical protein